MTIYVQPVCCPFEVSGAIEIRFIFCRKIPSSRTLNPASKPMSLGLWKLSAIVRLPKPLKLCCCCTLSSSVAVPPPAVFGNCALHLSPPFPSLIQVLTLPNRVLQHVKMKMSTLVQASFYLACWWTIVCHQAPRSDMTGTSTTAAAVMPTPVIENSSNPAVVEVGCVSFFMWLAISETLRSHFQGYTLHLPSTKFSVKHNPFGTAFRREVWARTFCFSTSCIHPPFRPRTYQNRDMDSHAQV